MNAPGTGGTPTGPREPREPSEPDDSPLGRARASSTVRLVRLRLALGLLAAAIPIVVALVVPVLLGTGTGPASAARAHRAPAASVDVDGAGVPVAVVTDASGVERLRMQNGQFMPVATDAVDARVLTPTLALHAGQAYLSAPFTGPDGSPTVAMTTPLVSAGRPVGLVRFDLSLVSLLADPQVPIGQAGGYPLIVDTSTGIQLADTPGDAAGAGTGSVGSVLRGFDVTAAQGYLLGRPSDDMTVDWVDLDALLAPPLMPNLPGWATLRATPA